MPRPRSSLRNEVPRGPSPTKTIRIPLNDDDTEKAQRIRAKNLLHKGHRNSLAAAAATPRKNYEGGHMEGTPKTPRNVGLMRESLNPITPLRKQPTVVNYEEWMKMHNDNVCPNAQDECHSEKDMDC